ncbi:MAG TPA: VCBS repeat-containing protein, partial [Candidatus Hydrogenedentes bacterium]|nr:VCBS repeat-containing protein [Candidatus Hydrogenedentota bacterium]
FYAHGKEDPGALEPALLCWYELQRDMQGNPSWTRHVIHEDSGVGTQFEVCDVDGDGLDDIAVSSKKGVRIFLQRRDSSS